MAKNGLTMTSDKVAGVVDAVNWLSKHRVMVGIPDVNAERRAEIGEDPEAEKNPITNAALGYIHENGAPEVNIPARPWLVPGVQSEQARIAEGTQAAANAAFAGNRIGAERILHTIGLLASSAAKRKITTGPFVPLAPATLAARRARGRTGTRPLIDTGQMRQAVTYVIRMQPVTNPVRVVPDVAHPNKGN